MMIARVLIIRFLLFVDSITSTLTGSSFPDVNAALGKVFKNAGDSDRMRIRKTGEKKENVAEKVDETPEGEQIDSNDDDFSD
jgi:hypothetical protein